MNNSQNQTSLTSCATHNSMDWDDIGFEIGNGMCLGSTIPDFDVWMDEIQEGCQTEQPNVGVHTGESCMGRLSRHI